MKQAIILQIFISLFMEHLRGSTNVKLCGIGLSKVIAMLFTLEKSPLLINGNKVSLDIMFINSELTLLLFIDSRLFSNIY